MIERREALIATLVELVQSAGGETSAAAMDEVLRLAEAAAAPGGAEDLTPHEVLRIRLSKAVARALPPEAYRQPRARMALRQRIAQALEAHGVEGTRTRLR